MENKSETKENNQEKKSHVEGVESRINIKINIEPTNKNNNQNE